MNLLTTERLSIRRFSHNDGNDLAEMLMDAEIVKYEPYNVFTLEKAIEEAVNFSKSEEFWAVVLGQKVIGKIYWHKEDEEKTYQLGYTFNRTYHHNGYATEATKALIAYMFLNSSLEKVIAYANQENVASCRLLERLGFHFEKYVEFDTGIFSFYCLMSNGRQA